MHFMIIDQFKGIAFAAAIVALSLCGSAFAQDGKRGVPKPVTVPISLRFRDSSSAETREVVLLLREDGDPEAAAPHLARAAELAESHDLRRIRRLLPSP